MTETAAEEIARWPVETPFTMVPRMSALTPRVIPQTLRARPIGGAVARKITRPMSLAGYQLPAGVIVAPTMGLVHAGPRVYPDPGRFDPQRMLGATLAMAEMRIVLCEEEQDGRPRLVVLPDAVDQGGPAAASRPDDGRVLERSGTAIDCPASSTWSRCGDYSTGPACRCSPLDSARRNH